MSHFDSYNLPINNESMNRVEQLVEIARTHGLTLSKYDGYQSRPMFLPNSADTKPLSWTDNDGITRTFRFRDMSA